MYIINILFQLFPLLFLVPVSLIYILSLLHNVICTNCTILVQLSCTCTNVYVFINIIWSVMNYVISISCKCSIIIMLQNYNQSYVNYTFFIYFKHKDFNTICCMCYNTFMCTCSYSHIYKFLSFL